MCSGYTILADRQGSAADSLRVIEGKTRRRHVDEFQTDLDIGAVLFQLDASAGFKRDGVAAYFFACSFRGSFTIRLRVIAARNGKRPARRPGQICNLFINLRNIGRVAVDFRCQVGNRLRVFIDLRIHDFELSDIDRVGVLGTGGYIGNLAAFNNFVSCLIDSVRAYADGRFGCFPCRFELLFRRQGFYEVRMLSFPCVKSRFRFGFFIFRRGILKCLCQIFVFRF